MTPLKEFSFDIMCISIHIDKTVQSVKYYTRFHIILES